MKWLTQERRITTVCSVAKILKHFKNSDSTRCTTAGRRDTTVCCVTKLSKDLGNSKVIRGLILERSQSAVLSATSPSLDLGAYISTKWTTPERRDSNVCSVASISGHPRIFNYTSGPILEKSHLLVQSVKNPSLSPVAWGDTKHLTLENRGMIEQRSVELLAQFWRQDWTKYFF